MQSLIIGITSKAITLLIGFFYLRNLSLPYKIILIQVVIATFCEFYGHYLAVTEGQNLWLFNLYMLAEIILIGLCGITITANQSFKKIVTIALLLLTIIWLLNIKNNGINQLANSFYLFGCILLISSYLFILFDKSLFNAKGLSKQPVFWLCLSVLIYFGCFLPYKGLENYLLLNSPKLVENLFNINLMLNFVRYPLIGIAFYLYARQQKPLSSVEQ